MNVFEIPVIPLGFFGFSGFLGLLGYAAMLVRRDQIQGHRSQTSIKSIRQYHFVTALRMRFVGASLVTLAVIIAIAFPGS